MYWAFSIILTSQWTNLDQEKFVGWDAGNRDRDGSLSPKPDGTKFFSFRSSCWLIYPHTCPLRPCSVRLFPARIMARSPWIDPIWIETQSQENMCSVNPRVGCIPGEPAFPCRPRQGTTPNLTGWKHSRQGAAGRYARRGSSGCRGGGRDGVKDTRFFTLDSISFRGHFLVGNLHPPCLFYHVRVLDLVLAFLRSKVFGRFGMVVDSMCYPEYLGYSTCNFAIDL